VVALALGQARTASRSLAWTRGPAPKESVASGDGAYARRALGKQAEPRALGAEEDPLLARVDHGLEVADVE